MPWMVTKVNDQPAVCKVGRGAFQRSWESEHPSLEKALAAAFQMGRGFIENRVRVYQFDPSEKEGAPSWIVEEV
ncbi:MAG: hypothetical protein ABFE07_28165 [Armatimonadia bacterium]